MPLQRVFLAGMMRFSLLYIALAFSALQQFNPDPDEIELWITRGWLKPIAEFALESPWLLTAIAVGMAVGLSWIAGILVTLNRHYKFRLWLQDDKFHKRSGLLTVAEGTIPKKRVQALIFRANALMRRYGWYALQVQTMGLESTQSGHQMAAPLARLDEAIGIGREISPFTVPPAFNPVSRLTIRRAMIRLTVLLGALIGLAWIWLSAGALWLLLLLPLIGLYAVARYRNMGYALDGTTLFVRKGVFIHTLWVVPVAKFQVLYNTSSYFQRRLGLQSVYVDTAGASGVRSAEIVDLPREESEQLVDALYAAFQGSFEQNGAPPPVADAGDVPL